MNNKLALALAMVAAVSAAPVMAESSIEAKVGAEMWWPNTKVNEVRRDNDNTPSVYASIEHSFAYVPDVRFRYSSVDSDYMAFDKYDLTFYYRILEHDLMHFDAGVTVSDLANTQYINAHTDQSATFDEVIWAWYGYAELTVPNTNFDIIGEMNFGDSSGIKSTDLIAGIQYRLPLKNSQVAFRGGYRAIDLESETFREPELGKPFIFADGWFLGAEFSF